LITSVNSILFADVDRIYRSVDRDLYKRLSDLANDPHRPVYSEGAPKDAIHKRLLRTLDDKGLEPDISVFELQSFRQEGKPSLQTVVATTDSDHQKQSHYADLDLDLGNPLQDVQGFFIHLGEVIDPGKTDHLNVYKKLVKDKSVKPFLYYVVTE
jgi:hypothetical protein